MSNILEQEIEEIVDNYGVPDKQLYQLTADVANKYLNWYEELSNNEYDNIMDETPFGLNGDEHLFNYFILNIYKP